MLNKKSKTSKPDELVPVLFAGSMEEAEDLCQLLEDHGVKASLDSDQYDGNAPVDEKDEKNEEEDKDDEVAHGVPVFVSKTNLEEANEVISERDDDIDEFALGDDDLDKDVDDDEDFGMGPDTGDDNDLLEYDEENLDEIH